MEISFDLAGKERKALVRAIAGITGIPPRYLGAPTMSYAVGGIMIGRTGTVTIPDGGDTEGIRGRLAAAGFREAGDKPLPTGNADAFIVSVPMEGFTDAGLANLERLVQSKATLIRKALAVPELPVRAEDGRVCFPWFSGIPSPEEAKAYADFIGRLCTAAKTCKRVTAKDREAGNDKYAFRCFLLRLGFIGDEYKTDRKILLRNLTGSSAFKEKEKDGISR